MNKIIGISGRKQAGKSTVANYINGDVLKRLEMVRDFCINENGDLVIHTENQSGVLGYGILDTTRKDNAYREYADREIWPSVKTYHFADTLKAMCITLFGLSPTSVYGNDRQKNVKTNFLWEDMPSNPQYKSGSMSAREFLEYFGTEIVRCISTNAWVLSTINTVIAEGSTLAIIPDVRFPNEVEAIQDNGGVVIRLARDAYHSDNQCENALDKENFDWERFDMVIDNTELTLPELCTQLSSIQHLWN